MNDYYYKKIKKLVALGLVAASFLVPQTLIQAAETLNIGVLQYVEHESLNANYEGFLAGLKEAGYVEGENLKIDFLNAAADNANLQSMAEKLVNANDYFFAIATPAAQVLVNIENNKPVYFSAVTDPVGAGLVESLEKPNNNVSGTTDAAPLEAQIHLLKQVNPQAKTVGIIYNAGETNSISEAKKAKELLEKDGLTVEEATVTSTNDVSQVMTSLVAKVDIVFLVTDNTIASAMTLVGDIAKEAGVAIVGGSEDMILENGLATFGLNYYNLGKQTAQILVRQIEEDLKLGEIPVESAQENNLIINEDVAKALNIDVSKIKMDE